jgi:serine/threonine protein kinase
VEPPLWDRIQEIYYSTLPIGEAERRTFVDVACDSDPFLVREVTSLLEADESSGDFLESPVFELGLRIITSNNPNKAEDSASSPADPLIGSTIDGRYLIEKELGRGGMGAVYLARDLSLHNRPIVIKTLLQKSQQEAYVVKKFRQEVEALARIDHPGVVSVLGAGKLADGKLYIGMQYVNGVTLRSQIPSEGMNFERAASILKQVGAALDDVHAKGIFHRDLKPENIMLQTLRGGTELVKIVDFGIAKVKDSVVAPSTVNEAPVGTVLYMSPEQLRGQKIAAVSDIYSMAVIAYEMVTGRRPFNPTSGPQLLEMHRAGVRVRPIDLRSDLSTEAQAIILRALSFEPKDRYQAASDFGDALACALSHDRESAKPAGQKADERSPRQSTTDEVLPTLTSERQASLDPAVTPAHGFGVHSVTTVAGHSKQSKVASSWVRVLAVSLLVGVGIAALTGIYNFYANKQASGSVSKPQRSFSYWLTVQKVRDGRNYQDPFQSSGQEIFENGYKFRLNVSSPDPGYLYVLNEGAPEADGTTFTMLYPTPSRDNAFVSNQPVHTNWNRFRGQAGTENMWIIWSTSLVSELESAKTEAFANQKGAMTDANSIRAVREFLTKHAEPKPESTKDTTAQQTHVRGTGDVVMKLAQLEHR